MPILVIQKDLYHAGSLTYVYQDFGSVENIFDERYASHLSLIVSKYLTLEAIAHNYCQALSLQMLCLCRLQTLVNM